MPDMVHDSGLSTGGSEWFIRPCLRPRAALRLICIPHAGGNAWVFREWAALLPEWVELWAVQLPGHGHRLRERPIRDFPTLLEQLGVALAPVLEGAFALLGHSMGALLAWELARRCQRAGQEPRALIVSGRNAPQLADAPERLADLDDREIIDRLRRLNCTPEAVLQSAELMELSLPVVRADFAVIESHVYQPGEPLNCRLTALGGLRDPQTDLLGLEAWGELGTGRFTLRQFPGDHFFIATHAAMVVRAIGADLAAVCGMS